MRVGDKGLLSLDILRLLGVQRQADCFLDDKVKDVTQQNIGAANAVQSRTELPR